jgi:hypothetical protein
MSATRSVVALLIPALAIFAGILAGDSGMAVVNRDVLVLGLLATAGLAVQSALAWRSARGLANPVIFVREGIVQRSRGELSANDPRRSVSLAVDSGQAVVVERNGLFSRVLGPGLSTLRPAETVYKIVSTQPRTLVGSLACVTREGITVAVDFEVSAQIMPRSGNETAWGSSPEAASGASTSPLLPAEPCWSEDALVRAAYETHSWESAVLSMARSSLREQFARSYLSGIHMQTVSPEGSTSLESLQSRCRRRVSAASSLVGINTSGFQITHLGLPFEIAGGTLLAGRGRRPDDTRHGAELQDDDSASQPWTAIRLASVLGGGPFVTFRQAMRARTGDVIVPEVLLEGQRWVGRTLAQSDPVPYELRPDRIHYDVQVHGRSFQAAGLADGEHLLFASLPEPADGDIVAVLVDGQMELRRYCQKSDHVLLEPERESQSLVALVVSDDLAASLRTRYMGFEPAIEVRQTAAVKVLGRAAIAFRHQTAASRAPVNRTVPQMAPLGDPESEVSVAPASEQSGDDADTGEL